LQINEMLAHVASSTGKMIRPMLVCLSGKCCGKINISHTDIAAIIEMVHIATLLHDDVIDQADSRRNLATINSLWGNKSAVLLGDFLLSKAFAMAATLGQRISEILAETATEICQGELKQNSQSDNWRLSEKEYFEIIEAKTASLFGCSCKLGAIASGADGRTVDNFSEFGLALGMAFQIADDLIDITGTEANEGKTLGRDIAESKPTLPIIHLLNTLPTAEADELIDILSSGEKPENFEAILHKNKSLTYSRQTAQRYCEKAIAHLEKIKDSQYKELLKELIRLVITRGK